jgi:hypothetical protein
MPRNPYFSGSVASDNFARGPAPQQGFMQGVVSPVMQAILGAQGSAQDRKTDAQRAEVLAQQARLYGAQADQEVYTGQRAQQGDAAIGTLGSTIGEYGERVQGMDLDATQQRTLGDIMVSAFEGAVGGGADPKVAMQMIMPMVASSGNDELVVRLNAAAGKYLGANESPSLARQDFVREDVQAFDADQAEQKRALEKYGLGLESGDRRYNTDVDAGVAIRGQNVTASTSRANNRDDNATSRGNNAYNTTYNGRIALRGQDVAAQGTTTTATTYDATGKPTGSAKKVVRPTGRAGTPGAPVAGRPDPLGLRSPNG